MTVPATDMLKIVRLSSKAKLPMRGSPGAAGYDLYSAGNTAIPPMGKAVIPTDLKIAVPAGTYGRVAPRSGLAVNKFIDVGAGVIDYDYRGPLSVVLFNFGQTEFVVQQGDRIAQLVLERIVTPDVIEVEDLDNTERGGNGFGSTGTN